MLEFLFFCWLLLKSPLVITQYILNFIFCFGSYFMQRTHTCNNYCMYIVCHTNPCLLHMSARVTIVNDQLMIRNARQQSVKVGHQEYQPWIHYCCLHLTRLLMKCCSQRSSPKHHCLPLPLVPLTTLLEWLHNSWPSIHPPHLISAMHRSEFPFTIQ